MDRKPRAALASDRRHTATIRKHTSELKRHTKATAALTAAHDNLSKALDKHATVLANFAAARPSVPTKAEIKAGIADAMSNGGTVKPGDLKDDAKVTVPGGAGALVEFLSKLNDEFWHDNLWHITPDDLAGKTYGKLVDLIWSKLGGTTNKPPPVLTTAKIKAGIADAMSNGGVVKPGDLKDDAKVTVPGGAGALVQFLNKLNDEFWHDNRWHIIPDDLAGKTYGKLVKLIQSRS